jgi:hypothetical protein
VFGRNYRSAGNILSRVGAFQPLVQALSEARAQYNWTTDLSRRNQAASDYAVLFSEDNLSTFEREEEEECDRQFLTQAERILSPEQLVAFQQFQPWQRQSQIGGMKMAARLLAPRDR